MTTVEDILKELESAAKDVREAFDEEPPNHSDDRAVQLQRYEWKAKRPEVPRQRFYQARARLDVALALERRASDRLTGRLTFAIAFCTFIITLATLVQAWAAFRQVSRH
jgi:hypothetical protein